MSIKIESDPILGDKPLSSLNLGQFAILTQVAGGHGPVKVGDIVIKGHEQVVFPISRQWLSQDGVGFNEYKCRLLFTHERIIIDSQ